jgi:hypothetical protein
VYFEFGISPQYVVSMMIHDCHWKTINSSQNGIGVVTDPMNQYLAAGVALIVICLGNTSYVLLKVWSYSEQTYFSRDSVFVWLVQCSASLLCAFFGGYLLAFYPQTKKASSQ